MSEQITIYEEVAESLQITEEADDGSVVVEQIEPEVVEVEIQTPGPAGSQGPQGPQGIPGPSGDDYTFEQTIPSATWTVTHNLGRYPGGIQVISSTGQLVGTEIVHDSVNQFRSIMDGAETGWITYT